MAQKINKLDKSNKSSNTKRSVRTPGESLRVYSPVTRTSLRISSFRQRFVFGWRWKRKQWTERGKMQAKRSIRPVRRRPSIRGFMMMTLIKPVPRNRVNRVWCVKRSNKHRWRWREWTAKQCGTLLTSLSHLATQSAPASLLGRYYKCTLKLEKVQIFHYEGVAPLV